ncbi:uncharacterized protein FIESC28_01617 [Fusarium coffeatum]|uniref:Uncharacterized protein n=1 Tax=Fusarium coffeatum TaxID=231269 RepID=A0A366S8L4_9HYPO|nr:uncharacterized protein FIESC28_01617 [Fusarium coffeatum]RBR25654.1 hypothetical protein FIESC28_01617 [Fusarium coffeatum]
MSEEIPIPVLPDTEPGEEKTAGPFTYAEYVAFNMGIERADENISVDRIRRDELLFYDINYIRKDDSNINSKVISDRTALHVAAETGLVEVTRELLQHGANIKAEDRRKSQPLHIAVREGHKDIVELLLNMALDIEATDSSGYTALHIACRLGHTELVELLLSRGAKTTAEDYLGRTPLNLTCFLGNTRIVHLILNSSKSTIDQFYIDGCSPLMGVVFTDHEEDGGAEPRLGALSLQMARLPSLRLVDSAKRADESGGSDEPSKGEEVQPEKNSSKVMPASALYMPYLCFSTHYREGTQPEAKPPSFGNYYSLLSAYSDSVIHKSPTLDEANTDRINRNEDQVVTKFLKELARTEDEDHFTILRVNQIRIWVVGNKWILTASSCSLDDNHDNLVEGVLDQLNKQAEYGGNRSQPESADAMAKIIVDYCVGSYDRKPKSKARMSISQIILELHEQYCKPEGRDETEIFKSLSRSAPEASQGTNKPWSGEEVRDSINKAKNLFCAIKDVRDELNILKSAARFQKVVQRNLARGKRNADISADYVENDIREIDEVASTDFSDTEQGPHDFYLFHTSLLTFVIPFFFVRVGCGFLPETPSWVFAVIFLVALEVSIIIYLGAWFVTNPSVRHFVSEFVHRALSGQSDFLKQPSNSDGEERPKDEKDHGSDNKKADRDQRLSLSMDTATIMRSRKSRERKFNMRGGMSHDASWYA